MDAAVGAKGLGFHMSLKNNGVLMLTDRKPHTPQTIATCTRHQVGTVERALRVFIEFGLVEVLNDGAFYMSDIQLLIGQSSTEGERKRRERLRLQEQNLLPARTDICPTISEVDKCLPILEIKKEIDIESEKERDGTSHTRRLRQIPKHLSYRHGAIRTENRNTRHLGFLHQPSFRVYGIQRKNLRQPRRNHPQMGGK